MPAFFLSVWTFTVSIDLTHLKALYWTSRAFGVSKKKIKKKKGLFLCMCMCCETWFWGDKKRARPVKAGSHPFPFEAKLIATLWGILPSRRHTFQFTFLGPQGSQFGILKSTLCILALSDRQEKRHSRNHDRTTMGVLLTQQDCAWQQRKILRHKHLKQKAKHMEESSGSRAHQWLS